MGQRNIEKIRIDSKLPKHILEAVNIMDSDNLLRDDGFNELPIEDQYKIVNTVYNVGDHIFVFIGGSSNRAIITDIFTNEFSMKDMVSFNIKQKYVVNIETILENGKTDRRHPGFMRPDLEFNRNSKISKILEHDD